MSLRVNPGAQSGTFTNRISYMSVGEFIAAPTSLDLSQLVQGGTFEQQREALAGVLSRASAIADNYCQMTLAATQDTQSSWPFIRQSPAGWPTISLSCSYAPVLELVSCLVGYDPVNAVPVLQGSGVTFGVSTINVPIVPFTQWGQSRVYAEWTYVNGWPHSFLAANAVPGDTELVLGGEMGNPAAPPVGIYAGTQLTIYQDASNETVQVAPGYSGGSTVPLVAPIRGTYSTADYPNLTTVTALPPDIRQAVISLATALIKARGDGAVVLSTLLAPSASPGIDVGSQQLDLAMARTILQPYRRPM